MRAYGIPVQSFAWKPASTVLLGNCSAKLQQAQAKLAESNSSPSRSSSCSRRLSPSPDLEACQISSRQLEDLMDDDDCQGPGENANFLCIIVLQN